MLILTPFTGVHVYAHFFRARERADFVNMHCACAYYVDPRRQVKLGRALSRKFWIQAIVKLASCSCTCKSIIAHCAIFARPGPGPGARIFTWTGKAFIWRHLNVIICEVAFMLPQNQRFAIITFRTWSAPFCAFWISVYKKMSTDATVFCTNHVWKRWFWPQKVEHKRTQSLAGIAGFTLHRFVGMLTWISWAFSCLCFIAPTPSRQPTGTTATCTSSGRISSSSFPSFARSLRILVRHCWFTYRTKSK